MAVIGTILSMYSLVYSLLSSYNLSHLVAYLYDSCSDSINLLLIIAQQIGQYVKMIKVKLKKKKEVKDKDKKENQNDNQEGEEYQK